MSVVLMLLLFGVVVGLVFILNNTVQVRKGRDPIGFFGTWLAFLTAALPFTALVILDEPQPFADTAVLLIAAGVILFSVPLLLFELRRPMRNLLQSRGLLGIGVGALLVIARFTVPLTYAYLNPAPESTAEPVISDAVRADEEAFASPTLPTFLTNTPAPTSTATRTPRPTLTPTSTRRPFGRPTSTPTPTLVATGCTAQVTVNLRLRAAPNTDAATLATIPFDTVVPVFGRSADVNWLLVSYEGLTGWASGEYLALDEGCSDIPLSE